MIFWINIFFYLLLQGTPNDDGFKLFISSFDSSYSKVNDYSCKLYKKELVEGKYKVRKNIIYKFKKPDCFYLNWTEGEDKGLEVLYAGKKYNYKSKVHPGGLFSFVDLAIDPRGKKALEGCRHSILDSDFGSIIEILKKNYDMAVRKNGVEILELEKTVVDGKEVIPYKFIFPKSDDYYGHVIIIYLDLKLNLPLKFVVYDKNLKLLEDYEFWDLKINNGFDDMDFDVKNPKYKF